MNTHLIHWQQYNRRSNTRRRHSSLSLFRLMDRAVKYLAGTLTVFAVVIAATWLIRNPALIPYLQAAVSTSGLLFIGLALEVEKTSTAWFCLATGIALPLLAFLSAQLAPELLIVAAFLVAAWLGTTVAQFDRTARR
jgi:hypothetical protein